MRGAYLEKPEDVKWLNDTHLKGVLLPTGWKNFKSAVVQGNEDAPYAVNLYIEAVPAYTDNYLRVTFEHEPPIYCEYCEYDGNTDKPVGQKF